ncbi:twin-arginine translocase subunit TatC [Caulobacter vibrioides]|uniref:Sec-independent protein translocase protein TatC n=2 Tax=Caulobacter vibrioides TaxID=155892 RepID=Q9A6T2_CAUVC|nr:twin-arginine translocase subunit TatC [Caulobacter vibrioides]YP_002517453.1 Sec-independent protein translocase protein tatC [Caulobacter vibrioides NA1000]QBQ57205.1 twin-arginine translocase subunit TatC [synthetic Caulobacter sp. 'ethensis']AAK23976.1 MttB family protein [Caulobacter vibrioides CB15]ACL95545.1 Sec-independent protein translocase protein tatC [Caulobacter vibrioides NA1000]ATC28874.1 twin-arginine translocase subunit TatC [Caulobacter vibrioides]QXZ50386.1 twin-arginin
MSKAIGHDPDEEIEASRAPLLDHLIELRMRLIICVVAIALAFGVCFAFVKPIFLFLVRPFTVAEGLKAMQDAGGEHGAFDLLLALVGVKKVATGALANITLQATAPLEQFFTNIKLAAFGGIILAFPVIAWQLYRFVAPGLYKKERNAFLPFLIASPVLFLMGASLVYYVMLPFVLWFSLSQQMVGDGVQVVLQTRVSEYLTLVTTLLLAFGLSFQLPVVLSLGGLAGLVTSQMLRTGRRYAIVAVFVVAAIVTPPDPISQITLAVPLCLLYEISIWCVWLIERRRKEEDEKAGTDLVVS